MKGDDPEIDTAQTPKRFDGPLALLKKVRMTFTVSNPNNQGDNKIEYYAALNERCILLFSKSFALSAKLHIAICDNCIVTSLSTTSGPWSELSDVILNVNETAYCAFCKMVTRFGRIIHEIFLAN